MMHKRVKAFSLVELLLSMGLFALLITAVASLSVDAVRATRNSGSKVIAAQRIQELSSALLLNKDQLWSSIVTNTNNGDKVLVYSGNTYVVQNGTKTDGEITVKLNIAYANRDVSGNIVQTGGTQDIHTRAITYSATWRDFLGVNNSVSSVQYLNDWNTSKWTQTTSSDFNQGVNDKTVVTNTAGGEVQQESVVYADWCRPSLTQTSYDLPGQGIAKQVMANPGNIYMGTGSNSSGVAFARMSFVPSEPPVVTVLGTFDGYKTNSIFGEGNYAYLATQTNSKEVVILNVATTPYTEIGYFNPSVNSQGLGVFVNGNVGYVATSTRLYAFDLSVKTGARPSLGYITLLGTTTDIYIRGNYAYITLSDSTTELEIVDLTNPASMRQIGTYDVNQAAATSIYVNEAGTRAYVGTTVSGSQPEFFVVDIANKNGTHRSIGSYNTNGMAVKDIVVPANSNRAIIVGTGGVEQYQVATLDDETHPQYCGGLSSSVTINSIAAVTETNGNVYTDIVVSSASSELRVIRGGAGGGGSNGLGYALTGEYTSKIFDTTSATAQYYSIDGSSTIPADSTFKMQVRSGNLANLTGSIWVGPDGTNATYFTSWQQVLPTILNNNRYFQYKAYFGSPNNSATAILDKIELTYQK